MRRNDAMGAVAELAASQHGAFSTRQAAARGLSRRQIRSLLDHRLLFEPIAGVLRFPAAPVTWRQRMMIATLAPPGNHAGFRAAALLHQLDGFRRPDPPLEIVGPRGSRALRVPDLVQHWVEPLPDEDLVVVDGIPTTGLARTVVDVCGLGDPALALRAVDDFERRRASLNWLRLTAERLHRPGQSGTGTVLRLLERRQLGGRVSDTWFERLVERCLAAPGLPPWVRQHEIHHEGQFVARVDLACPALLLAVEAHSRQFHFGAGPESADQRRENQMSALGWQTVYVGWYSAERPHRVATTIAAIARKRAQLLGIAIPWAA